MYKSQKQANAVAALQRLLAGRPRLCMHRCCTAAPRMDPFPGGSNLLQGPLAASDLWDLHTVCGI